MTTKHDYKAALFYIQEIGLEVQSDSVFESIIHALKVAHAVMQEPSEAAIWAADAVAAHVHDNWEGNSTEVFKAMRDKMLEGVE